MIKKWKHTNLLFGSVFCILGLLSLSKVFLLGSYPDFTIYYFAAIDVLQNFNPYFQRTGMAAFIYPPITLLIFMPFTLFPIISSKLWIIISYLLICGSLVILYNLVKKEIPLALYLFLSGMVFLSFPTKFTLGMGQITSVLFFLFILLLWFSRNKKYILAGIILGISLSIKFFPVFVLLWFALYKNKRIILVALVTGIVLLFLPLFFMPFSTVYMYWIEIFPSQWASLPLEYYNQSFAASLSRYITNATIVRGISIFVMIFTLGFISFHVCKQQQKNEEYDICLYMLPNILFLSIAWQHYYVLFFIPWIMTLMYIIKNKLRYHWIIFLFVSFILVATNLRNPYAYPALIQTHTFVGGCILLLIMILLKVKRYV